MKTVSLVPYGYDYQTIQDMRRVFEGIGFKESYSPDTMHDFANAAAARAIGEEPEFKETEDEYFQKLSKFLKAVDFSKYSGNSPLGKAASLYVAMHNAGMLAKGTKKKHQPKPKEENEEENEDENQTNSQPSPKNEGEKEESQDQEQQSGDGDPEEGEGEPEFDFDQDPNAINSDESMDGMVESFLPEGDGDGDDQDGKSGKQEGKKPPTSDKDERADPEALAQSIHDAVIKQREFAGSAAAMYTRTDGIIPEMALGSKLSDDQKKLIAKLTIVKSRRQIQNHRHFTALRMNKMTKYSQVAQQADMSKIILPDYDLRFIQKRLRVGVKEPHGKQCAIYLVDASGSMRQGDKIEWVRSILLDRYDQVLTGQAELYIVPYEGKPFWDQAIYVSSKADVRKHLNWMPAFNLGWTQIQDVIEETCTYVQKGMVGKFKIKGERPEIVVVCDGDDHCDPEFKPSIRTHAFILGQKNKGLKTMCENCGGSYEEFYIRS